MRKVLIPFILGFLALTGCGERLALDSTKSDSDSAIIGGVEIQADDSLALSVVSLREKESRDHICTGTLLSSRVVLTAAHCVDNHLKDADEQLEVVTGISSWVNEETSLFPVAKIIVHPVYLNKERFDRDAKIVQTCLNSKTPCSLATLAAVDLGDVALILLGRDVPADEVSPVVLNTRVKSYVNGAPALVVGLGQHSLEDSIDTGFMRAFKTRIYRTYKDVNLSAHKKVAIPSTLESGACFGDSGGPVFIHHGEKRIQVGIGQGALELDKRKRFACNFKSLGYTDIASYLPWILQAKDLLEKEPMKVPPPAIKEDPK